MNNCDGKNLKKHEKGVITKKVTQRDVEMWEVALLNSNIESCSKPSEMFSRLEEKRRICHENLLNEFRGKLQEIDDKTEKNITISSEEVKAHIKYFDEKLKTILESVDKPEVGTFCGSLFEELKGEANEYKSQQQKLIDELLVDLNQFEDERAEENKKLFHVTGEKIRKNGYLLPYELQKFIELEALKFNQLSLNNRRCYEDLNLQLTLITEQMYKSFMDKVFCIQEKWVQYKIQEAYFSMQKKSETKIAKIPTDDYFRLELKGHELAIQFSPEDLYSTCKIEEWSKNVDDVVTSIENYGKNLIEVYKKTTNAIYQNFNSEVDEIKKQIAEMEALEIEDRIIKPLVIQAQNDQTREVEGLECFWQETLVNVRSQVQDVNEFLREVAALWDRHNNRVCESKKLILKALERADEVNRAALEEIEIKINIALDTLRQEFNENKLDKAYEAVIVLLNSLKAKYESIYLNNVAIVEDFFKMMNLESDVLSAELKEFIYVTHPIENAKSIHHYCDQHRSLPDGKPIFKEIQMCSQQIKAVRYWKQGIWTALECLSVKTNECLEPRARSWVEKKIEHLAEKMALQLEVLDKRFERVKVEIYEKRKEELVFHERVFEKHKAAVKSAFEKIREEFQYFIEKQQNLVNDAKEGLIETEEKAKAENRAGIVRGIQGRVERSKNELEEKINFAFDRFSADCEIKTQDLKQANFDFMKDIKLFYEGGNFSSEEGKMYANLLEEVDREISSEYKNIAGTITKEKNDFVKKSTALFVPTRELLNSLYEETLFDVTIRLKFNELTAEIREIASNFKSDFELLKKQTDCFCRILRNQGNSLDNDCYPFWISLIRLLYKNVSNLFYPAKMPETPELSVEDEEEEKAEEKEEAPCVCPGLSKISTKATVSATPTFRTIEKVDDFNCKDYKNDLFGTEEPPGKDGTFMSVVSNMFWVEMDALQKLACTFYKSIQGKTIIRKDLVPLNYDDFAKKVLSKLQSYNMQCEQLWLQTILEFLPVIGQIKLSTNYYLNLKLNGYQVKILKCLSIFEEDFVNCLVTQTKLTANEFETLENKLLPLHGYPQNKGLLGELEEEVVRRVSVLGLQWDDAIKRFKSQLKCFRLKHVKKRIEVNKIQSQYISMKNKLFVDDLGNHILDFLQECSNKEGFWVKRSFTEAANEESNLTLDDLSLEISEAPSIETYYRQLKDFIAIERSKQLNLPLPEDYVDAESNENPCFEQSEPKVNVFIDPLDVDEMISKIVEKLKDRLKEMKALGDSKVNSHEEILFKWLEVWKLNVRKVQKLYTVKYQEKPDETDKVSLSQSGEHSRRQQGRGL